MAAAKIDLVTESPEVAAAREARFSARKVDLAARAEANADAAALKAANDAERAAIVRSRGEAAAWHLEQGGRVVAYGDSASSESGLTVLAGAVLVGEIVAGKPITVRVGK